MHERSPRRALAALAAAALLSTATLTGCAAPRSAKAAYPCPPVLGARAALRSAPGPKQLYGVRFTQGPLRRCRDGHAVTLTATGRRALVHDPRHGGRRCAPETDDAAQARRCARRCVGRPLPAEPCDLIDAYTLVREAATLVRGHGYHASTALGGCGPRGAAPEITLVVHDWRIADIALGALQERLRAWDARGEVRLIITPIACGVAL